MAFGKSTMSRTQVQLWYNRFQKGRDDINDDACSGHLSISITNENIEAAKKIISDNYHYYEVTNDVSIPFGSCQAIFTDVLDMKYAAANIVPKLLNFE